MELVEIKHHKGCAVACLAMILGVSYDEIADQFDRDFDKHAMEWIALQNFLGGYGYSLMEKRISHYEHKNALRKEMLRPFAPFHIANIKPYVDSKSNHAVVMDSKGKLFDPAGHSDKEIRAVFEIDIILGIFPLGFSLSK